MKISLGFLVLVTVTQLCTSNILSKSDIQDVLLSDGTENGIQNGSDVIMVKPGPLDVILTNGSELVFEVCEFECNAEFLVCFESDINGSYSTPFCDTKCGYYVNTSEEDTTFMEPFIPRKYYGRVKQNKCTELVMKNGTTIPENEHIDYKSCHPKIENGIVKLTIMNATDECRVSIKNAKIKQNEVVTQNQAGNSVDSRDGSDDPSAANYIGNFGSIFILIMFYSLTLRLN